MALDPAAFETIVPSRYITFTLPNPHHNHFTASLLRIAVIDSPIATSPTTIAAMLVPLRRESDWAFSTESGSLQLILSFPQISRLVLIGNCPDPAQTTSYKPPLHTDSSSETSVIEDMLMPLLFALCPKESFHQTDSRPPEIPFLTYEDEVVRSHVLETCIGDHVGEMVVEDVELEAVDGDREFRRRLRFKRMPHLIQTQIRIHPDSPNFDELETVNFIVDNGVLVHPYLTPMVAGLSVIASYLDERIQRGYRPKALCLGVGGGALLSFLNSQLNFEVLGVEEDESVLRIARKYFGLKDSESIRLCIGDGMDMIRKLDTDARKDSILDNIDGKFDAIMVDLDSSCAGMETSAPPPEFIQKPILLAAKRLLSEHGVIIINVISLSKGFHETLINEFQGVFEELYEVDVVDNDNVVVIATQLKTRRVSGDSDNSFMCKLESAIGGAYMDSIGALSCAAAGGQVSGESANYVVS
ncbi:unnamed protein product [Cuscuta epithymum]|uniref:Methyltransferase-like protein 13 n=1 Tax=Cuscuta epithymum TaxID=186058 RepID=A0AAV0EH53_9ASTE|nr:unnamed protein product [Cuscuta epithymum]